MGEFQSEHVITNLSLEEKEKKNCKAIASYIGERLYLYPPAARNQPFLGIFLLGLIPSSEYSFANLWASFAHDNHHVQPGRNYEPRLAQIPLYVTENHTLCRPNKRPGIRCHGRCWRRWRPRRWRSRRWARTYHPRSASSETLLRIPRLNRQKVCGSDPWGVPPTR